jgi:hypothetical protein
MNWSQLLAVFAAGAALGCAPLIGLDDLHPVACETWCEGAGGGSVTSSGSTGTTSTSGTNGTTSSVTSGPSTTATGAGGSGGASTSASGTRGSTSATGAGTSGAGGALVDAGLDAGRAEGGMAGASGGPSAEAGPSLREELIDAVDDNRLPHPILSNGGRNGYWFTINDGTVGGTQSPSGDPFRMSSGGVNGSPFAAHLSGQGFTAWGIYMGFTLNKAPQGPKYTYDARTYRGVSFWAKLGTNDMCAPAADCHILRFNVSTRDTDPRGNVCTSCDDHFGAWVTLSSSWQKYVVLFTELAQEGWGVPGPAEGLRFDASRTYEVQFVVQPAGKPFDYWIDQVSFVLP